MFSRKIRLILTVALLCGTAFSLILARNAQAQNETSENRRHEAERRYDMMRQEMQMRFLELAELEGAEKDAAKLAISEKEDAYGKLMEELVILRQTVVTTKNDDKKLEAAVKRYQNAFAAYKNTVEAADKKLQSKLSVSSQAKCLTMGILENGISSLAQRGAISRDLMRRPDLRRQKMPEPAK